MSSIRVGSIRPSLRRAVSIAASTNLAIRDETATVSLGFELSAQSSLSGLKRERRWSNVRMKVSPAPIAACARRPAARSIQKLILVPIASNELY